MTVANTDPLSDTDKRLLSMIQTGVPIVQRPFARLGEPLGLTEAEVIERITALKRDGIIRQISAIFDTRSIGYASSLVAARCDAAREEAAAAVISAHPGVSHNYKRNHDFNIWFTLAVPPTSRFGLEKAVDILQRLSGAQSMRLLPTLKLYKIGVQLDIEGSIEPATKSMAAFTAKDQAGGAPVTRDEVRFIREMQRDLPVEPEPFAGACEALGVSCAGLAAMAAEMRAQGKMRRFSAVLNHRQAGFAANAMGVWPVDPARPDLDAIGEKMAAFRAVSHCYRRPTYPDWPYSLFTMVHGRTGEECEAVLAEISRETGVTGYRALYSTKEWKKTRVVYFDRAIEDWEAAHAGEA
ncbi:MAG: AsnC family transcriptional regulator [Verrucomicrobia bacterium]|nr:AsnC family transcriptional regulator [Verrucomicrobiota bacterium]